MAPKARLQRAVSNRALCICHHQMKRICGACPECQAKMNGDSKLTFLPLHTQQLNPAEVQVPAFKKRLAGRCFDSSEDLKQTIRDLTDTGEVAPVKLMDYLLPAKTDTPEYS